MKNKTYNRKKILILFLGASILMIGLFGRLAYLMIFKSDYYRAKAEELHERERSIKAARGDIVDANGVVLATNKTVCTISVIHSQLKEPEKVIEVLSKELELNEDTVRKKVEKYSSREVIKSNVEKKTGDQIREYQLDGVKVDEDYKRYYPYHELASKVLGFTGSDNQGIIGLEVKYEEYLKGKNGTILTTTDARGVELEDMAEERVEAVAGNTLQISLDYNIQTYAQQAAEKVMEEKQADAVSIIMMNPQNGEIKAMVNVPEFDLNNPFSLESLQITEQVESDEEKQTLLNQMWRNRCINDTYEPGSTFKTFTTAACIEEGILSLNDHFYCPGYRIVEDRRIRCHKTTGHGSETFLQGIQNSCNPVFMDLGARLGTSNFYKYFEKFGLMNKTGVDLPGEAGTIIHKQENVKAVELATMSFGQSFQISPLQLCTTVSSFVNGGKRITPHLGVRVLNAEGKEVKEFQYKEKSVLSEKTSQSMRMLLESVVSEGTGKNAFIEGYEIGGKTATSQTLPRSANKYISSFIGFAPADNPKILGLVVIYNPKGIYYGGTIAAPVFRDIMENILPYLGIEKARE